MKKTCILFLFMIFSFNCFSQTVNQSYFPKDNEIDRQYKKENQTWVNNSEWKAVILKYKSIWKQQMYLEMERLISIIPESEKQIRKNQKKWGEAIKSSFDLVAENVDFIKTGENTYIGEYLNEELLLYRERAKYYLCLYYTIKEQNLKGGSYIDVNKTELAN